MRSKKALKVSAIPSSLREKQYFFVVLKWDARAGFGVSLPAGSAPAPPSPIGLHLLFTKLLSSYTLGKGLAGDRAPCNWVQTIIP
ncbi:hypothetical protein KR51_00012040 [Rubidibacter lacunae KORDI 51-2]|uniref:Uncharacterized protein n=1 Tax=Rubidibacter lacunae KORDI 51-2 TaxID=582515 RepID=U5DR14_9CHRO|nr:hypothetical protein KR51_00012040 [Rubidibacter lacunae KORDI 51-2]